MIVNFSDNSFPNVKLKTSILNSALLEKHGRSLSYYPGEPIPTQDASPYANDLLC